jgi:hypothetical protein
MLSLHLSQNNSKYKNNSTRSLLWKPMLRIQRRRLMILMPLTLSFAKNSRPLIFCSNKHNPEYKNLAQSSTKIMNLSRRRTGSLIRDNKKSNNCKRILRLCKIQSINSNFSSNNKQMISLTCNRNQRIFLIKETYLLYSLLLPLYLLLFSISECGKLRNQHLLPDPNLISSNIADLVERKKKKYQLNPVKSLCHCQIWHILLKCHSLYTFPELLEIESRFHIRTRFPLVFFDYDLKDSHFWKHIDISTFSLNATAINRNDYVHFFVS